MAEEKKQDHTTAVGIASKLARPNILALQPYRCARDDYSTGILLDANENALGPTSVPTNGDNHLELERYPDPYQTSLKQAYCTYRGHGLTPSNVFCGVGSDEAIDLLMRIFCTPQQDVILTTPPTYGMYKVCAKVNDVDMITVPLTEDFELNVDEMLAACTPQTKLMFVCSPGNPTSKAIPLSDVKRLASSSNYQGLVVVDEAYVDFSTKGTALSLIQTYPNIVVLQTLSKAFGLAGIRCGFAVAAPDVIQLMNNVKAPYNVNALTEEVALNAFHNTKVLQQHVAELLNQRDLVEMQLNKFDFVVKVYPSDSNFLLFRVQNHALELYKMMADGGVVTRFRGTEIHCKECIRVTIGTPQENKRFLQALEETWNKVVIASKK